MFLRCGFGFHRWTFWEDVGVRHDPRTGADLMMSERCCADCGRKQRLVVGHATAIEVNQAYAAAQRILTRGYQ